MKLVYRIAILVVIVVNLWNSWVSADEMLDSVVSGNTHFAFELYAALKADEGNLFFSPYSISTALAMTYAGARHNTAEQMAQVLHFTLEPTSFHPTMGQLQQQINASQNGITLNVANSLWIEKEYSLLKDFLEIVKNNYSAELNSVEFQQAEEAANVINVWVEEKTSGKIQDIVTPGQLKLALLVLVNAIYFKGNWASQFEQQNTRNEPFWITPDLQIEVPMMIQSNIFNYMQNEMVEILELPYQDDDISMVIFLPRTQNGLAELENRLSTEEYTDWLKQLHPQEIIMLLPKFKMEKQFELSQTLAAMGMPDAFSDAADFSGMDGSKMLVISDVVHKAFVEVNEEGTEAAAVTGVIAVLTSSSPPHTFRADHPFLFLIRHQPSESILFLGRVVNPLAASSSTPSEAILSPELQLYIPKLRYQSTSGETIPLWANLKLVPTKDDKLLFEVVDYGVLETQ